MADIDRYAVFGQPVQHSQSPLIHRLFAEQTDQNIRYDKQEVSAAKFEEAVDHFFSSGGKGLNCTVPLKELAWQKADKKSDRAQLSKAVNTLMLLKDGTLFGDNTDGSGLVRDLIKNHGIAITEKKLLLLGAGGASRGILGPLIEQKPASILVANRTAGKAIALVADFQHKGDIKSGGFDLLPGKNFDLILNATAASLTGELPPLPDNLLIPGGNCYDLAYGTKKTPFVHWGETYGAHLSLDGIGMLVEQAADAFEIWRGVRPKTRPVIEQLNLARRQSYG